MAILEKEKINDFLHSYYAEHYGESATDEWFEQPAVNVWVFARDDKVITLHCHILTGQVSEQSEDRRKE